MAAVNQNGLALEYAEKFLKKEYVIVMAAVNKDGSALK